MWKMLFTISQSHRSLHYIKSLNGLFCLKNILLFYNNIYKNSNSHIKKHAARGWLESLIELLIKE